MSLLKGHAGGLLIASVGSFSGGKSLFRYARAVDLSWLPGSQFYWPVHYCIILISYMSCLLTTDAQYGHAGWSSTLRHLHQQFQYPVAEADYRAGLSRLSRLSIAICV